MKRKLVSKIIIVFTVIIALLTSFAACNAGDVQGIIDDNISKVTPTKLDTPSDITFDDDYVLRWSAVSNASSYVVTIDGVDYSSNVPSLNISKVLKSNGSYEAYLKALSDRTSYENSDVSAPFKFPYDGIKIVEEGNRTTGLFGLFDDIYTQEAYIGYGYDVIGSSYVNANEVKMNYRIFDADKLKSKNLVMIKDHDSEDYYISGDSLASYQASVEAKYSSKVNISKAFTLSVNGKFSRTRESTASALFYEYSHTTKAYQLILQCDFEEYKEMLTASFKRDIMTLDMGTLFTRYGTHVITSVIMGGRFDLDYTMTSDSVIDMSSLSVSIDSSLKAWGVNAAVDASASIEAKAKENNTNISSEARCYGGDYVQMNTEKAIMTNYQTWLSTIESKPALVGIRDINSLVPIWELLGDSEEERARKAELSAAFEKYGEDSYNSLLENYSINPPIAPTSLNAYLTDKGGNEIDESNISAGEKVYLKTEVEPSIAVYTKNVKFDKEEYVEYNSIDNSIIFKNDTPDDTTINVTVSIGHGLSKNISVTVYKYYNVNFNTNGGSEVAPITKIRSGQKIDAPANPTKEGKLFSHWYYVVSGQEFEFSFSQRIEKDLTLFANWEDYYPTVTYIHNINYSGAKQEKVSYNAELTLPELSEYGYDFKGYFSDSDMLTPFDRDTEIKTETTIYVKWDKKTFTITFETNGGSEVESQSVKYKEKATRQSTAKDGATFAGWFKDEGLNFVFDFSNDVITQDITLYAGWTANPVTVCFDTHGGNEISEQTIDYGTTLGENLFTPEKTGYTFKGWYLEENYVNRVYKTTAITADCSLHAKWEANTYVVVFNPNGASGSMSGQDYSYDEQKALDKNLFTKVGYTFAGWAISSEDEVKYVDEQIVKNLTELNEITLYAKWKLNKYTVKFDSNGGNGKTESQIFDYGEQKALSKNLYVKEKRIFDGWALSSDGAVKYCDEQIVKNLAEKGEVTLFAVWKTIYEWANNEHTELYFGSYPQTDVTSNVSSMLNGYVAVKPTTENSNGWTSYGYYINGSNATDYMWYKDVDVESDGFYDYRAVYFTSYRPYWTSYSSSTSNTYQDENGYYTSNVYWFKYEPIKWRVLASEDGYATLLCSMAIDSQDYNYTYNSRTIDGKTVYANNYEYSSIRAWLNDTFYNTAFNSLQKSIIETVEVDNSARSTSPDTTVWNNGVNNYACNNTFDKVWLLSEQEVTTAAYGFNTTVNTTDAARQMQSSDYAKAQGCWQSTSDNYRGCCWWWLRSPYYNDYDATRGVYSDGIADYGDEVNLDSNGVLPALTIRL